VAPLNLYGATKLCADKLVVAAGVKLRGKQRLAVVRFGNFWGSRGSVLPYFLSRRGALPVTHPEMTRFSVTGEEAAETVKLALSAANGGEIFVPRSPTYRVGDLAAAIGRPIEIIGMRPGEKLHEEILVAHDAPFTLAFGGHYVRVPRDLDEYRNVHGGNPVPENFSFVSSAIENRLSIEKLRDLIRRYQENAARYGDGF
jgi:FlaA1/EpsC-like NDP-sugar epimerase